MLGLNDLNEVSKLKLFVCSCVAGKKLALEEIAH